MKRRLEIIISGQQPDRVPCVPILAVGYASKVTGMPLGSLYEDPKKCIKAQLLTAEMHDYEALPFYGYAAFGAFEFGGEIELPREKGMSPWVTKTPVKEPSDVEKLEVQDPKTAGSIPITMEAAREAVRAKYPAVFPIGGIFTWTGNIIGIERTMRWIIREPDLVHEVLKKATDFSIAVAEYFVEEFGPESSLPLDLAPTEANSLISPQQFEKFALPYIKKVHEKVLKMGVPNILTHICGEQNRNLENWKKIPFGKPGILSFGSQVDLDVANKFFGKDNVIMGNVETTTLVVKKFEDVLEYCRICVEKGKKIPAGFLLSPGCEIPPIIPPVNMYAMVKAAREYGVY